MHSFKELLRFILRSTKRVIVLALGLALVAAGLAMLVLPGPGLLVIIAGLAILAHEFSWAATALDKAKEQAARAGGAAKQGFRRLRRTPSGDGGG